MVSQMDLFLTSNSDFEEEQKIKEQQKQVAMRIEKLKSERNEFLTKNLTTRQHRLVDYLEDNFIKGKYFSIEDEFSSCNLFIILFSFKNSKTL